MILSNLNELLEEAERIDENCFPPIRERQPIERSLGTCDRPDLRKLYALATLTRRDVEMMVVESRYSSSNQEEHSLAIQKGHIRSGLILAILWYCLQIQFNHWGPIGLRKDWEVVIPQPSPHFFLESFF